MATPGKDGFTLVKGGSQSKKRKADGSPLLHSPPGASSASPINTPARPKPSTYKNSIPAKAASKTLVVKVSEKDFIEFLDLNKIIYAKAERLTSKQDGRVLQMFKLEIKDEAEAEVLIAQISNLSYYRYHLQSGGISVHSFSTAVLELPKHPTFGKKNVSLKPNV